MSTVPVRTLGLVFLVAGIAACGKKAEETTAKHEHHAPHHGALEVLGDEFAHVELVLEGPTGKLTAYVLDGEAENPVRIAQDALRLKITGLPGGDSTVVLNAVPNALSGEKVGDTSKFEGAAEPLKGSAKFQGSLETITVRGTKFDSVEIGYPDGNEHEEKADGKK